MARPGFWELYGSWLVYLHPAIREEVERMAQETGTEPIGDWRAVVAVFGLKQVIDQVGVRRVLDEVGLPRVLEEVGLEEFVSQLTPEQREEVKRLLQE